MQLDPSVPWAGSRDTPRGKFLVGFHRRRLWTRAQESGDIVNRARGVATPTRTSTEEPSLWGSSWKVLPCAPKLNVHRLSQVGVDIFGLVIPKFALGLLGVATSPMNGQREALAAPRVCEAKSIKLLKHCVRQEF